MELKTYLPFWNALTPAHQTLLAQRASMHKVSAGVVVHNGAQDCIGLLVVTQGQLRAYSVSQEGREVTLFRLLARDFCLFSASCVMRSLQFDVTVEAERDTAFWLIPPDVYHSIMLESAAVANYTNELMAQRLSDMMWLMEQILYQRMDARVAGLLLEESALTGSTQLKITHDRLARHLGSAREVVTRTLKYLHNEGLITLSRGGITLSDPIRLARVAGDSIR